MNTLLSLPSSRSNLLYFQTSFVGRSKEIQAIYDEIKQGQRLLSIIGPGGVGKTRLAIEVASSYLQKEQGISVRFCDLSHSKTLEELFSVVASRLGVELEHSSAAPLLLLAHVFRG
jgi:predicted ATPase